ncbi:Blue-light-activated histidine kinase [Methyloligella halotolerans]|uniref:Blue-light-activated histidine kinase n=1 Tax=Methyloligella halotolerans TaxID=1177755 RepID=A0A1E2S3L3_9HYPH|nr:HWE histidine kinase domain-containing protein [Methyloligella halotolerans]ODA68990.1 Blue-light-activated histidine kinase [Methyloligella halotolerans]
MTDVPHHLPLPQPRRERVAVALARVAAVMTFVIGAYVLAAWRFDLPADLPDFLDHLSNMRPDAALGVLLGGLALFCFTWQASRPVAWFLAMPVIAVSLLALAHDLAGWQFGLNQALSSSDTPRGEFLDTRESVRMSLGIGIALLLFGLALAAAGRDRTMTFLSELFSIALLVQVLIVLTGYAYGITTAYSPFPFSALSVYGASSAFLLGIGLLLATPESGVAAAVLERSPAGEMLRRLLPGIVVLPLVTGFLAHQAEINGIYGSAASYAIFAVASIVLLAAFVWTTTQAVRAADKDRADALHELSRQREWLQITLDSISDGVIATDAGGNVLLINRVAEDLTGWSAEQANGRPIAEIFRVIDESTRKPLRDAATIALAEGEVARLTDKGLLVTSARSELPIENSGAPILGVDGTLTGSVLIFRDVTEPRRAAERQTMLVGELNHRVKNALAIVQSLVQASLRHADNPAAMAMAQTLGERLQALHRAHDLLLESQWSGASLKAMAERELAPYMREDGPTILIKGPDILLPASATSILAMTLHELATNAVKYGALSQNDGNLEVVWRKKGKRLRLSWLERGSNPPKPGENGFGMQLIDKGIRHNLGGETKLEFRDEGLYVELDLPIEHEAAPRASGQRQLRQQQSASA